MSMTARFVQVSPDTLQQLIADPERVAELFTDAAPGVGFGKLLDNPKVQERLQSMGSKLLSGAMAGLRPDQREALTKRLAALGVSLEAFEAGTGGAALGKLKASRAGNRPQASRRAGAGTSISLDKDWHGVHFLLCGAAEPGGTLLSQVVMGGVEVGEDDNGYGPARYFTADRTAEIARALADPALEAAMKARFDPARMTAAELYPGGWEQAGELDRLMESFRELREFFTAASQSHRAVITCIV